MRSGRSAQPFPQAEPPQFLPRLESEHFTVNLAARAQDDFAQHLDTFGFGARIRLEWNVLRQSFYRLLVIPVVR